MAVTDSWTNLPYTERIILAYSPKPSAFISAFFSLWTAISIYRDKKRMSKLYHRLALGMCVSSTINAFFFFIASWAVPSDTTGCIHAFGNQTTCRMVGFFHQVGIIVCFYYVSLALYVFLSLENGFRSASIAWVEKYIHVGVIIFPLASGIYLLIIDFINPAGFGCYISTFRAACDRTKDPSCYNDDYGNDDIYLFWFGIFPIISSLIIATLLILASYIREKNRIIHISKYSKGKKAVLERARHIKANLVAKQGTVYLMIFYSSYLCPATAMFILIKNRGKLNFPSLFIASIFLPLDGFFFTLSYRYFLLKKSSDELTIEMQENDNDNDNEHHRKPIRRLSFSLDEANKNRLSNFRIENDGMNHRPSQRRRSGKVFVSLFEGTDEENWKIFGVYEGSGSDCSSVSDHDIETDYPAQ